MKTKTLLTSLLALTLSSARLVADPFGTAFTYQGQLNDGASPANGFYDLRFSLWNTAAGGRIVAGPITNAATAVSNGLFTVTLDFGPSAFAGDAYWLGMGVRSNATGNFTTLSTRQQLTATPYAILASGVGAGDITSAMLSSGAVTSDKIAAGAVKTYQIDDGGSAGYEGFQTAAQSLTTNPPLPFASLWLVAATNGTAPAFSLTVNGLSLGTVVGFSGTEGISRPYCYVVEVQSSGAPLNPDAELGLPASLTFTRNGRTTSFGGIVTACARSGGSGSSLLYSVRIEPRLVYLALNTDYRVNQNLTAPNVAAALYQSITANTATVNLTASYALHENLIQYAETDLNFFNRLLEDEGVFYFFNQSASPPSLTLADDHAAYLPAPNSPFVYYGDTATNVPAGADYIRTFQSAYHQSTIKSELNTYDFTTPSSSLLASSSGTEGVGANYQFGTAVKTPGYVKQLAAVRQDRQAVERAAINGSGTAPDLRPGYTFTLADQSGAGLGGTYLVTDVQHAGFVRVTNGVSTLFYGNQFTVIPASLTYRPARRTPRPQAQPCTAVVTGPAGEEIYTDKYGRVKVQFHWDRYGSGDQNSSAWLRMSTPMASGNFRGMLFLPRIGDEVLVSFIQGDPDQPIVTGSLYNANNVPPYALPASKTISTIRSTGSKAQPTAINEIKFDDLAGSQVLNLEAAKDMNLDAANDMGLTSAHDMSLAASGKMAVKAAGNITFKGSQISLGGSVLADTLQVGTMQASGSLYMNDQDIHWRGDNYHGAGWYGVGKPFAGASPDGPVLYGYSGGGLGTIRGTATNLALVWNYSGYVGIGNTSPGHLLTVGGGGAYCDGGSWVNGSDRNAKENFTAIDPAAILEKVAALPLTQWNYKSDPTGTEHLGPMAQDFHAAFGLNGSDDRHIATVDEGGVALAAIQGLNQKLEAKNAALEKEVAELKALVQTLAEKVNGSGQ